MIIFFCPENVLAEEHPKENPHQFSLMGGQHSQRSIGSNGSNGSNGRNLGLRRYASSLFMMTVSISLQMETGSTVGEAVSWGFLSSVCAARTPATFLF